MKKQWREKSAEILLYGMMLVFCILFIEILPLGHDLHFHLYRIGAMAEELERTSFSMPIRILSASYNNYGYGVPLFYGDLLLYIPAILVVFGMNAVTAYKILMVTIFLLTFIAMYKQIYRSSISKNFAFLAAAFYSFSSYYLIDLCIRMAVGEACAYIFLPLVFCSFYNMLYQPRKDDWLYLALGMSGLVLSHCLTAAFTAIILGIWSLLQFHDVVEKGAFRKIIFAAFVTVGLTASFVFPFIEALGVQKYQIPSNNEYQMTEFSKHALDIVDFFLPYDIKKALKVLLHTKWDTEVWHPGAVGIFLLILVLPIVKTRKKQKNLVFTVAFWTSVLLYMCMFIKPLVTYLGKYISFMQFGWRVLIFCTFAFAIYAAYMLNKYFDKRWQNVYVIFTILLACYSIAPRYLYQMYLDYKGMEYIETFNPEFANHYIMKYSPNSGDNLYLPEGVNADLYIERGDSVECNHEDVQYQFVRQNEKCYIIVTNNPYDDTKMELPLYYYKGYTAIDESTGEKLEVASSENKLVEIFLGGGYGQS